MEKPKILIVEDEQIIAVDLERNLTHMGYHVVGVAARKDEAVRLTGDTCPDLVLMDIQLEGQEDGIAAAAEIRRKWRIPVVFLTANTSDFVVNQAKVVGPLGYVAKPFTKAELSATIAVALQQDHTARNLFAENDWLTTLLASLTDGVIATDRDATVRFMNPVAERLTGWSSAEAQGRPIEEVYALLTPEGQRVPMCQLRRALATQQAVNRERFMLVSRAGRRFFIEDAAAPIRNSSGEVVGAATIFLDVTERLAAEQERERLLAEFARSNDDLARFSYAVSHDLQAPVRTIHSLAELLARRRPGSRDEDEQKVLTLISQAAQGMQRLIQSLLKYAQAGQGQIQCEAVPLGAVIDAVEVALGP
ncbi:MAG TPA: response regulator, partial [Gemmatimonadaceae bacterium]|nr:response regulator [Gemmatimonadaceae bacterium]